jgi:hypothetical protein
LPVKAYVFHPDSTQPANKPDRTLLLLLFSANTRAGCFRVIHPCSIPSPGTRLMPINADRKIKAIISLPSEEAHQFAQEIF